MREKEEGREGSEGERDREGRERREKEGGKRKTEEKSYFLYFLSSSLAKNGSLEEPRLILVPIRFPAFPLEESVKTITDRNATAMSQTESFCTHT